MPKYYTNICLICKKQYKGRGKIFCGKSCTRTYLNLINNPTKRPEVRVKLSIKLKGKEGLKDEKHPNRQGKKYIKKYCTDCNKELKGIRPITKRCIKCRGNFYSKEKHPNWKGGITNQRIKEYNTVEYLNFVKGVLKRDNYTCQYCSKYGNSVKLEVHHIKSYAEYPELRFEISNGVTLCKECLNNTKKSKRPNRVDFIQTRPKLCVLCNNSMNFKNRRKYCKECKLKYGCKKCGSFVCGHKERNKLIEIDIK